jgi:predicted MFS family arabinose efflux permease
MTATTMEKEKMQAGWTRRALVVLACAGGLISITMGLRQGFGLFLAPVTEALKTSATAFSLAIALQNLLWGAASPIFGGFADRFGAARVAFCGGLLYAGGLAAMALARDTGGVVLGQALVGLGLAGAGFSVALGAVARAAPPEKRSMALGIATAAGSLGQFALVPVGQGFIAAFGWQGALIGLSCIALLMTPIAMGLRGGTAQTGGGNAPIDTGKTLRRAATHRDYVLLTIGFFACGYQIVFITTHLPAYLKSGGVGEWTAAAALALVGLFNIFGTLGCGWLGGFKSKKNLLFWVYMIRSAAMAAFIFAPISDYGVLVFGAFVGIFWLGTVPLTSGLITVFFGARSLSMLYGITFLSHQIGSFLGAWLGGALFDLTGDYTAAWWSCVAVGVAAAVLHYPIRERVDARPAFA